MAVSAAGPVVAWYAAIFVTRAPEVFLPYPHQVVYALVTRYDTLLQNALVTLQEIAIGMGLGIIVGVAGALALVSSPALEKALMPWVVYFHSVPKLVLAPLFAIWFGSGITSQVLVVVLLVFFPILVTTVTGLKSVEPDMMDLVRSMGASRWQVLWKLRLPNASPFFFSGLKLASTFAPIGAIVGEWVGGDSGGLGQLLLRAQYNYRTSLLFADLVVLVMIGLALYQFSVIAERWALPWHAGMRGARGDGEAVALVTPMRTIALPMKREAGG